MPICPVCKSESARKSWRYKELLIFECLDCDLQFVYPMQAAPLEYYQANCKGVVSVASYDSIHPGYQFTIKKIREVTRCHLSPDQRRVIDVACGPGFLLIDLQRDGFDCLGIDFNPDVVRVANERFQVPAKVARVEDLTALDKRFDLALLVHVLEHVEDPLGLLKNIRQILNPAGVLVVEVPNRKWFSLSHSLGKGTCSEGDYPPHHITFWSLTALTRALELSGYSVLECIPRLFDDMNRIETFLRKRLCLTEGYLLSSSVQLLRWAGWLARLQGGTLHAVARRLE